MIGADLGRALALGLFGPQSGQFRLKVSVGGRSVRSRSSSGEAKGAGSDRGRRRHGTRCGNEIVGQGCEGLGCDGSVEVSEASDNRAEVGMRGAGSHKGQALRMGIVAIAIGPTDGMEHTVLVDEERNGGTGKRYQKLRVRSRENGRCDGTKVALERGHGSGEANLEGQFKRHKKVAGWAFDGVEEVVQECTESGFLFVKFPAIMSAGNNSGSCDPLPFHDIDAWPFK